MIEEMQITVNKIQSKINRFSLADETQSQEKAPKYPGVIEQEHSYYLKCPVCNKASVQHSKTLLTVLTCINCISEVAINGKMLFNSKTNETYYSF